MTPPDPSPSPRFPWAWAGLLYLAVLLLLAARLPSVLARPCLFAEEGVFFKQAYEQPFWSAIFTRFAGYLSLAPRLMAGLCGFLPIEWLAHAYVWVSLILMAAILTFFILPGFRAVIASDWLRGIVVLALPFMPNAEGLLKLPYLSWYSLFFVTLVSMMELPENRVLLWGLWLLAVIAAWSCPVVIVCLPVIAFRSWQAKRGRVWWAALGVAVFIYVLTAEHSGSLAANTFKQAGWAVALIHAIGYRVFCFFAFGQDLSQAMLSSGWETLMRLVLILVAAFGLAALAAGPRIKRFLLLYYLIALPLPFLLRGEFLSDFLATGEHAWAWHGRYFFVPVLLCAVFCGTVYEHQNRGWRGHMAAAVFFIGWLSLHFATFQMSGWQTHPGWSTYARRIREAERRVKAGGREEVHIDTASPDWSFNLVVAAKGGHP